jgi:hypothetical protein
MTSPFTIAVALTTEGMAFPNSCGFSGRRRPVEASLSDDSGVSGASWAMAALPIANAATADNMREEVSRKTAATI